MRGKGLLGRIGLIVLGGLAVMGGTGRAWGQGWWPQFRGVDGQGLAEGQRPPVEFGEEKKLLWKVELGPGHSSPCIWGDKVFLTSFEEGRLWTIGLDRKEGRILWRQAAPAQRLARGSGANSPATPTPACDGQRVYALFGSYGLIAYDLEGREQWRRPLPLTNVRHGMAASPVIAGGKLIVNADQEGWKSFLLAVDPRDGKTLWQADRPTVFSSHTTPVYWKREGAEEIVVAGSVRLVGYDLKDGRERWSCRGLEAISICPSPVIGEGVVYAMSLSMGEEKLPTFADLLGKMDQNRDGKLSSREAASKGVKDVFSIVDANRDGSITREEWELNFRVLSEGDNGLFAVKSPQGGDVTGTHVLWTQKQGISEVSSPLYYRGRVFVVRDGGMASCFDARTGKAFYQNRRLGALGQYFASPIAADGKIYTASKSGVVCVIEAADELKVLARNDLGEAIVATPAIAENTLYVRTAEHLFAFGERK